MRISVPMLLAVALLGVGSLRAQAPPDGTVRIGTFSAAFSRDGPGLLLRAIMEGDRQTDAAVAVIARTAPDILLLTEFDYDANLAALNALAERLEAAGLSYPHRFAARPNTGMHSGLDLNGNGRRGEAADAQGFGEFPGDGGMAILSRYPLSRFVNLSDLLWSELPGGRAFRVLDGEALARQRLSTTAHWAIDVTSPRGTLTLLCFAATAPVFDGPEDLNGLRNADEIALWQRFLDGALPFSPPDGPFVILGRANLDPVDGEGLHNAIRSLLSDARLQDPAPESPGGRLAANPDQYGDPARDTADWRDDVPGNLRVDYILPAASLVVEGSGVFWPGPNDVNAAVANEGGSHKMVWVNISFD